MLDAEAMILHGGLDLEIWELFPLVLDYTVNFVLVEAAQMSCRSSVDGVEKSGTISRPLRDDLGKMPFCIAEIKLRSSIGVFEGLRVADIPNMLVHQ
jgi:hypothetical protein